MAPIAGSMTSSGKPVGSDDAGEFVSNRKGGPTELTGIYYAVYLDEAVASIFDAPSFGDAVDIKQQLQNTCNDVHGCDEVFQMRKATHAEAISFFQKVFVKLGPEGGPQ